MSIFYDSDGGAWKRSGRDNSNVGQIMNERLPEEPGNCLICEVLDDVETPATAHSMVDSDNGVEETIFSMKTCALHTARWDYRSPRVTHDGETQRG